MTQMTTAVAAERLGVSQRQVQRLVETHELPASRTAGDAWVVDALAAWRWTAATERGVSGTPHFSRPW